jgi:hypothetical protein
VENNTEQRDEPKRLGGVTRRAFTPGQSGNEAGRPCDEGESNVENEKQDEGSMLGGCTGLGFRPGKSGNPAGRPRSKGLVNALRAKMGESRPDGRTTEEHLVSALIEEGLRGKHRVSAIEAILDRLEGKARQQLDVNNISDDLRKRSTAELQYYLEHFHWPEQIVEPTAEAGETDSDDAYLMTGDGAMPTPRQNHESGRAAITEPGVGSEGI